MKTTKRATFAENVFDENKMKKYLPKSVYNAVIAARKQDKPLTSRQLQIFAETLSKWAIAQGATKYVHTFCPLNNVTAGKRDSLYSLQSDGNATVKFRAEELIRGESDASSFPSGGMRQIYRARGLTRWDVYSNPYVYDGCLYLPCLFCGANGEILDVKTPLLRSNAALNKQALRVLGLLGDKSKEVFAAVGAEQEYFLIDRQLYNRRPDLVYCGRTLFGALPPKGQQLQDNYFCPPDARTEEFWQEVDEELWKLGIVVKAEHREVAPRQYELAPCYERADIAADHNCAVQNVLRKVAKKHGLECLLHEKPFYGFNGSGKHNNWSLLTDRGENLLEIGNMGWKNARFLLFLAAIVKAVDDYCELLCAAISSCGNDCRLGGMEAPPLVMSVFLGQSVERAIAYAASGKWKCGKDVLPRTDKCSDRNRTSPFAFTGNKFEFRSVGSSANVAWVNTVLNAAVAESLRQFADRLERASNTWKGVNELINETFAKHKRIIFDGNNYCQEWQREAKLRNLKSLTSVQAFEAMSNAHNVNLFERHNVLCQREIFARQNVLLCNYSESVLTEVKTAVYIFRRYLLGGAESYLYRSAQGIGADSERTAEVAKLIKRANLLTAAMEEGLKTCATKTAVEKAHYCRENLLPLAESLREAADRLETLLPAEFWQLPTYGQMLFDEA